MEKTLSVVICAYNMEEYLRECLDSLICDSLSDIEVLIMNDGSTDSTGDIADEYQNKYPDSFIHVNKENGGYGSNINLAVPMAKGKFIKVLDADDWFETKNLDEYITLLKNTEADAVANNHLLCIEGEKKDEKIYWLEEKKKVIKTATFKKHYNFQMWDMAIKTQLVRETFKPLPEHTLYTDTMYIMRGLINVKTFYHSDIDLYCYRLGRDGQSTSNESIRKHYKELFRVFKPMLKEYNEKKNEDNESLMGGRLIGTYRFVTKSVLRLLEVKEINVRRTLISMNRYIKNKYPDLYATIIKERHFSLLRMTNYRFLKITSKKYFNK